MRVPARRLSEPASAILLLVLVAAGIYWTLSIARRSVAFAFAINWALMGLAYVVWLVVPLRFADGYYRVLRSSGADDCTKLSGFEYFSGSCGVPGFTVRACFQATFAGRIAPRSSSQPRWGRRRHTA